MRTNAHPLEEILGGLVIWKSRGYTGASIDHTYEATAVEFPDGRFFCQELIPQCEKAVARTGRSGVIWHKLSIRTLLEDHIRSLPTP